MIGVAPVLNGHEHGFSHAFDLQHLNPIGQIRVFVQQKLQRRLVDLPVRGSFIFGVVGSDKSTISDQQPRRH